MNVGEGGRDERDEMGGEKIVVEDRHVVRGDIVVIKVVGMVVASL